MQPIQPGSEAALAAEQHGYPHLGGGKSHSHKQGDSTPDPKHLRGSHPDTAGAAPVAANSLAPGLRSCPWGGMQAYGQPSPGDRLGAQENPFPGSWQAEGRGSTELLQRWEAADSVSPSLMCQGNEWRGQIGAHRPQTGLGAAGPEAGQGQRWPEPSAVTVSPVCGLSPTPRCSLVLPGGGTGDAGGDLERLPSSACTKEQPRDGF